jgi:hypothetical protein
MLKDHLNACASLMSPLIVAAVILAGLGTLCVENLNGAGASRQFKQDHTVAVQKLMFRN